MTTIVMIDSNTIGRIMNLSGVEGLDAIVRTGDKFFFSPDAATELDIMRLSAENTPLWESWLMEQRDIGRIVDVDPVTPDETSIYNPHNKNPSGEVWDMSARKFMHQSELDGKRFNFKVISEDTGVLSLSGRYIDNADSRVNFHTPKIALAFLTIDPNVDLSEAQFDAIKNSNFNSVSGINQGIVKFPDSYQESLDTKAKILHYRDIGSFETVKQIQKGVLSATDGKGSLLFEATVFSLTGALIIVLAVKSGETPIEVAGSLGLDASSIFGSVAEGLAQDGAVSAVAALATSYTGPGAGVVAFVAQVLHQGYKLYQSGEDASAAIGLVATLISEVSSQEFQNAFSENVESQIGTVLDFDLEFVGAVINTVIASGDFASLRTVFNILGPGECFLAGTPISLWGQTTKPIEEIIPGDEVTSYDAAGNLIPGKVTRIFRNQAKHILDVFGLHVTPGHVTFCGDGKFDSQHVPMIDILRSDGALVKEDGTKVRACTNEPLGSAKDQMIWAITGDRLADGRLKIRDRGQIRLGTRFITDDGYEVSVADLIHGAGAVVTPDGLIQQGKGQGVPFLWTFSKMLPKPEDYILQRSVLTLNDIYHAAEWEAVPPQMPLPSQAMVLT